MPTATLEEYIEAIYKLSEAGPTRATDIAEAMGVSAPTVTATLRRLAGSGLVERPRGRVVLTDDGRLEALSLLRRHRLAERFLVDVLGLPWDEVHDDACMLEHALSPRVQDALEAYLQNPDICPHGHPIPAADLSVAENIGVPLPSAPVGESLSVASVDETDETVLKLVNDLGLLPGRPLRLVGDAPDEAGLVVDVADVRSVLPTQAAARINVIVGSRE